MNTDDLILRLSDDAPVRKLRSPAIYALGLLLVLLVYGLGVQIYLGGLRSDLAVQLMRPAYVAEILLLAALGLSSGMAAILCMYPDRHQHGKYQNLPFYVMGVLAVFLLVQFFLPAGPHMVIPAGDFMAGTHCTITIASTSALPSILMFGLIRRGANVTPLRAGSLAVLTAFAIGCLTLRLNEVNDSLAHLLTWHYLPTLVFAMLGAILGRFLLRW